jgi:hypothetical protein
LQLVTSSNDTIVEPEILPTLVQALTKEELKYYKKAKKCIEDLALYLKPNGNLAGLFSRPMQRKLVTLINCQLVEEEGRSRSMRAARSLGERTVTELILQHQNPQQLSANLWAAVRARGCQFLGPAMQEEVLKLILLALETGESLSRKVLVMYVVQQLEPYFPQASKTSIGHVVQLLYRASCFKVSKREGDSSLMQLKEEFRNYKALRKEHDAQIVQIATEAGLRIAPDQWSALLYGDSTHKSDMQSLIDKQQSPQSFGQSVQELMIALQRTADPANLSALREDLMKLSDIDASNDSYIAPPWDECANAMESVNRVVNGLVDFVQHHGSRKPQDPGHAHSSRYKISFCRDLNLRGNCPRGKNCTFAHTDEEFERYRNKVKRNPIRPTIKESSQINGPNKVNIAYPNYHGSNNIQEAIVPPPRFNKQMPYRSENSLNHTPAKNSQHLMPTYPTGSSSCSTPNLSQSQLSPKMVSSQQPPPQMSGSNGNNNSSGNGNRFPYGNDFMHNVNQMTSQHKMMNMNQQMTSPTLSQNYNMKTTPDYKKQHFPTYNNNHSPPAVLPPKSGNDRFNYAHPMMRNVGDDFSNNNNNNNNNNSNGNGYNHSSDKYWPSKMKKSPNQLMAPKTSDSSNHTSPINRGKIDFPRQLYPSAQQQQHQQKIPEDEVDGIGGRFTNMWMSNRNEHHQQPPHSVFQFDQSQAKGNFHRSVSILKSNENDVDISFEIGSLSGKYGPIGIKKGQETEQSIHERWSGLQSINMKPYNNNNHFNNLNSYEISKSNNSNFNGTVGGLRDSFNSMGNGSSMNGRPLKSGNYGNENSDMNVSF